MKKLNRYTEGRRIAGVCAGLGEYFDLDPLLFRVAFLVSFLFGALGALVYLVMWMVVPEKTGAPREVASRTRLYRSPTDRKVAGVCGGLGELLGVDPVFARVAFVVLAFAGGLGIVLYLAFWLLMPEADAAPASRGGDLTA
jgi:phage shock protein PspC (stress-responsive transcriptional regulator)